MTLDLSISCTCLSSYACNFIAFTVEMTIKLKPEISSGDTLYPLSSLLRWYLLTSGLPRSFCVIFPIYWWWQWRKETVMHKVHVLAKGECQKHTISHLGNLIWKLPGQVTALFSLFSCFEFRNYALNVLHADGKALQGEIC